GCKEDGKENGKEDRFQATSREEDFCQKDGSQEAGRQEDSCEEDSPQEGGGQEGCAHSARSEASAQTACCGHAGAKAGCPSAPEADGGYACGGTTPRGAASSDASRGVPSPRAEALRSAARAATSGFRHAAFRAYIAFADAGRGVPDGAAPGRPCGPCEPHGAEAGIARSSADAEFKPVAVRSESCAATPRLQLDRVKRVIGGPTIAPSGSRRARSRPTAADTASHLRMRGRFRIRELISMYDSSNTSSASTCLVW